MSEKKNTNISEIKKWCVACIILFSFFAVIIVGFLIKNYENETDDEDYYNLFNACNRIYRHTRSDLIDNCYHSYNFYGATCQTDIISHIKTKIFGKVDPKYNTTKTRNIFKKYDVNLDGFITNTECEMMFIINMYPAKYNPEYCETMMSHGYKANEKQLGVEEVYNSLSVFNVLESMALLEKNQAKYRIKVNKRNPSIVKAAKKYKIEGFYSEDFVQTVDENIL